MSDVTDLYQCPAHVWESGVVVQNPTPTAKGKRQYICTVCGEIKIVDDIPMLTSTGQTGTETTGQVTGGTAEKKAETTTEPKVSLKKPEKTQINKVKSPKKKHIKITWKKRAV